MDELQKPCYVISSNGFKDFVTYEDDWCFGPSRFLGQFVEYDDARNCIKADIRAQIGERNGLPLYTVSDHGNINRIRTIKLRIKP